LITNNIVSNIVTDNSIGALFELASNLITTSKNPISKSFKTYLYKQLTAFPTKGIQKKYFDILMEQNNDYYYDKNEGKWLIKKEEVPFWIYN
jgi:hypothetical protein